LALVVAVVAGLSAAMTRRASTVVEWLAPRHVELPVHTLRKAPFTIRVPAVGELEAATSTAISVPRVQTGGLKIFWLVKDGSVVRQGDTLVEFDASELVQQLQETDHNLESALLQMEASVFRGGADTDAIVVDHAVAAMELDKAHTQAPRDPEIFPRHQIIEGELGVSLSTAKVAEYSGKIETSKRIGATDQRILVIERNKQEVRRGQLRESISSLKILAPRDGMVLLQKDTAGNRIMIGDTRWPGFVLMTMPDTGTLTARVQVLESDAGHLKVGQAAEVVVDSHPGTIFPARVERIDAIARPLDKDSPVKYFETILKVNGEVGDVLKPGKLVRADITVGEHADVLTAPRVAVVDEGQRQFVWVQGPAGPTRREVRIAGGDMARVVVTSGVAEGETVLLVPPPSSAHAQPPGSPTATP
jgi:multidrug efflux pump subunit AcrA (membrane-fusion protein)